MVTLYIYSNPLLIILNVTPDAKQWEEALRTEMKQPERLGVFSAPCPLPYGAKNIKPRVNLKKKRSKNRAVKHWKARLVAQGSF